MDFRQIWVKNFLKFNGFIIFWCKLSEPALLTFTDCLVDLQIVLIDLQLLANNLELNITIFYFLKLKRLTDAKRLNCVKLAHLQFILFAISIMNLKS